MIHTGQHSHWVVKERKVQVIIVQSCKIECLINNIYKRLNTSIIQEGVARKDLHQLVEIKMIDL